jgi:hypothetical protein
MLIVCDLFNGTVGSSYYITSNGRVITEWLGKDMEGSGRGLIESIIPAFV